MFIADRPTSPRAPPTRVRGRTHGDDNGAAICPGARVRGCVDAAARQSAVSRYGPALQLGRPSESRDKCPENRTSAARQWSRRRNSEKAALRHGRAPLQPLPPGAAGKQAAPSPGAFKSAGDSPPLLLHVGGAWHWGARCRKPPLLRSPRGTLGSLLGAAGRPTLLARGSRGCARLSARAWLWCGARLSVTAGAKASQRVWLGSAEGCAPRGASTGRRGSH